MTLAVSKAVHDGADAVVCASTGILRLRLRPMLPEPGKGAWL